MPWLPAFLTVGFWDIVWAMSHVHRLRTSDRQVAHTSRPFAMCAIRAQGTGDNGNVMGYLYQGNVYSYLDHSASYTYDGVNRRSAVLMTGHSEPHSLLNRKGC